MADKKKTFVMYESWGAAISMMNNEQAGALLKAIYEYQNNSSARPDDPSVAFVFEIIRQKMDDDQRKYEETCQTRSEAGRKGNDKRWSESQTVANGRKCDKESQSIAKDRKCDFCDNAESQTVANVADNDNESDNDTESDTDNDSVSDSDTEKPKKEKKSAEKKTRCEDPDLNRALNDFIESRKVNKKPMTERAITLLLNRLESLAPGDNKRKIELLNEAVLHGWQSVYVSRDDQPKARQPNGYVDAINNRMDSLKQWAEENGINPNDVDGQGGMF